MPRSSPPWSVINGTCAGRPFRFGKQARRKEVLQARNGDGPLIRHLLPAAMDHHCARHALLQGLPDRRPPPPTRYQLHRNRRRAGDRPAARHHDRPVVRHTRRRAQWLGRVVYPWAGEFTTGRAHRPRARSTARRRTTSWRAPTRPSLHSRASTPLPRPRRRSSVGKQSTDVVSVVCPSARPPPSRTPLPLRSESERHPFTSAMMMRASSR